MLDRELAERRPRPTAGVIDSQSLKAPYAADGGRDGAKRLRGRKRHVAADADGRLLLVRLTPADISRHARA